MIKNIIFDFGSTIVQREGFELIIRAAFEREQVRNIDQKMEPIHVLSQKAASGEMGLGESIRKAFELVSVTEKDVKNASLQILKEINPMVKETIEALQQRGKRIFIFSSNFDEIVLPVTNLLGIPEKNVYTNKINYDAKGRIIGFDDKNPLFLNIGKVYVAEQLRSEGVLLDGTAVVGNSSTDLAVRKSNVAKMFVYFSGIQVCEELKRQADFSVESFDQLLPLFCSDEEFSNETAEAFVNARSRKEKEKTAYSVLLLENINKKAIERFESDDIKVLHRTEAWSDSELCDSAQHFSALGIRSKTQLNAKTINCLSDLLVIGAFCIGTNQMDVEAAADAGIPIFNAPYSNTRSVAELVVGEIVILMRRIFEKSDAAHKRKWLKSAQGCTEVRGKTVGIIGYGHIGSQLSVLLEVLGMTVIFHDIVDKLPLGNAQKADSLKNLLTHSDVVTLHVPDTPLTRGMIGKNEINKMKPGSFLINSSRGKVVDLNALRAAIDSGHISGAAIDVFPEEPAHPEDVFESPLQGATNTIITPHIGGSTQEAQVNIAYYVSDKIKRFLTTGSTIGAVNFPEVELPRIEGTHRILHIHRNVPGVLAKINSVFARRKINVEGQILQTKGNIGYLIVDVNRNISDQVLDLMGHITETVKVRKIT